MFEVVLRLRCSHLHTRTTTMEETDIGRWESKNIPTPLDDSKTEMTTQAVEDAP